MRHVSRLTLPETDLRARKQRPQMYSEPIAGTGCVPVVTGARANVAAPNAIIQKAGEA